MPYILRDFIEFINRYNTPFFSMYRVYMKIGNVMYPVNNITAEPGKNGKPDTIILDSEIIEKYANEARSV